MQGRRNTKLRMAATLTLLACAMGSQAQHANPGPAAQDSDRTALDAGLLMAQGSTPAAGGSAQATRTPARPDASPANAAAGAVRHDARASELIGRQVRNAQGENLGEISDLIIDVTHQRVHYAVLSFGGFLGVGNKLFAYPVTLFSAVNADEILLNVPRERLARAPGFERERWPSWADNTYRGEVDRYFGPTVSPRTMPDQRLVRASMLIGKDVNDAAGRGAGEIEDLVVNLGNGQVRYVVFDFDKAWTPQDRLMQLPLRVFHIPDRLDEPATLQVSRDRIDLSGGFESNRWPDLNDPEYVRNVERALGSMTPSNTTPPEDRRMPAAGTR